MAGALRLPALRYIGFHVHCRVGKRSAPTICVLGKYRGKRNISGWGIRSVRHNAAFICASSSRERAKGARRRPLCNPGSRQKIAPAGKPRLFPSGHGSGMTIRPCIVMPSHRLLGPSLGLAPSGPTLRVVQKCSRHFCPSGASRPAVKRRGRFFLAGAKPSPLSFVNFTRRVRCAYPPYEIGPHV